MQDLRLGPIGPSPLEAFENPIGSYWTRRNPIYIRTIQKTGSMHPLPHPARGYSPGSPRRFRRTGGFTLGEVMLASIVILAAGLGIYTILIRSYELVALTRYRDDARAVLQTYASQFERLQTTDHTGSYDRFFFRTTDFATGAGLLWDSTIPAGGSNLNLDSLCNEEGTPGNNPRTPDSGLTVHIGGSLNGIDAIVTRSVVQIAGDGTVPSTPQQLSSAGEMLMGTFTITYSVYGFNGKQPVTQKISVLRAAP